MSEYRLLIAQEVLDFLDGLPRRERLKLRNRFLQIAVAPGHFAEFQERDSVDRPLDVHICGNYAVTYWWDFADRDVKILRMRFADR
jgi:hypothetical protein